MELGGQQSCSIPISGGSRMPFGSEHQRETALAAGCLAELILVALLALLLISLLSSAHSPGLFMDCLLTPFLHGTLLGHAAGIGSLLLLAKGLCTCPQLASGDAPESGQIMVLLHSAQPWATEHPGKMEMLKSG